MAVTEHELFYSEFINKGFDRLVIGLSGSGIIKFNKEREIPIIWQGRAMHSSEQSFLTLTTKAVHFWPTRCFDEAIECYDINLSRYTEIVVFGYSMGAWGALAQAHKLGAARVLSISPRTPEVSVIYEEDRFGPVEPMIWPNASQVTVVSDIEDTIENKELKILRSMGPFLHLNTPGAGHNSLSILNQAAVFELFFRLWLDGKIDAESFAKIWSQAELRQR
jgi:hypothetical protein